MLTELQVKAAKPRNTRFKLYDGKGLYLIVAPNGTKRWEFRYKFAGPQGKPVAKSLALGVYGETSLKEAREETIEARKQLKEFKDPAGERKKRRLAVEFSAQNTFYSVAKEWLNVKGPKWSPMYSKKLECRLECHIFPSLGGRPIGEINALDLLAALRVVESQGRTEMSHRLLQICRGIFQHAVLTQRIKYNPAHDLQGVLMSHVAESYPTIGRNELPQFFKDLERTPMADVTRLAFQILMVTFVRTGEMRKGKWSDVDLKAREWRLPADTTKMGRLHIVPLSTQAVRLFEKLKEVTGGDGYLFPTPHKKKSPTLCENAINKVIHRICYCGDTEEKGYYKGKLVGHGFRSLASTTLNENGFPPDVIERQLAHMPRDKVRAAYNRAQYLPQRREMMQWWGDELEKAGLKLG